MTTQDDIVERTDRSITALLDYKQADMDGIMVETSRQAIHEVVDEITRLKMENETFRLQIERLRAERNVTELDQYGYCTHVTGQCRCGGRQNSS